MLIVPKVQTPSLIKPSLNAWVYDDWSKYLNWVWCTVDCCCQGLSSHIATEKDPNVATKDAEDIPTFDEWKKKIMEKENSKIDGVPVSHTHSLTGFELKLYLSS